jgi:CubicO group peptidase (beta-lactamase class C family)
VPLDDNQLQAWLDDLAARHRVPGVVCAISDAGRVSTAATGIANLNTGVPMTVDTAYLTGSITKVVLSTIIMTVVEEGLLDLDSPLVSYAPDVQFGADVDVARSLTLRNVMNHSSGVDTADLFVPTRPYPDGIYDYLAPMAQAVKLTDPGIVSSYNNIGWIAAEMVLRNVTGQTFHELVRDRIIEPLGMTRTVTSVPEAILNRVAVGSFLMPGGEHRPTSQFAYPDSWAAPGTTPITTVRDTLAFLLMHLRGGVSADGVRLLTLASVEAMQTPTSPDPTGPESGFGLGWRYVEAGGRRIFSHGGGSPGGTAHALISPADDFAMVAFVNSDVGMTTVHRELIDLALPHGPSPLAAPAETARDDVDLRPFVGRFRRAGEVLDIAVDDSRLSVRITPVEDEKVGAMATQSDVPEFGVVPTGESSLLPADERFPGGVTALTFYEPGPAGYGLVYFGGRLSRRIAGS